MTSGRFPTVCLVILLIVTAALAAGAENSDAHSKKAAPRPEGARGVQIPFAKLKSEAEFHLDTSGTQWMLATGDVIVPEVAKKRLSKIDQKANSVGDPIEGVEEPCAGAVEAFNSLWLPDCKHETLARINIQTGKIESKLPTGVEKVPSAVSASIDSVWALTDEKTTLMRIDPDSNEVVAEMRVPSGCSGLEFGENTLWVACPSEDLILRIDPATNLIQQRIPVSGEPTALAIGAGGVWAYCRKTGEVARVDPRVNRVVKVIDLGVPNSTRASITAGYGSVWLSLPGFPITRIDIETEKVAQQFFGEGGGVIVTGLGSVWLVNVHQNTVSRLDPKRILATVMY
jgi:streptogramin lyase